ERALPRAPAVPLLPGGPRRPRPGARLPAEEGARPARGGALALPGAELRARRGASRRRRTLGRRRAAGGPGLTSGALKLQLKFPATPETASDHAQLAVRLASEEHDVDLDFSRKSLENLDALVDTLREDGLSGEEAAEALFVLGCYLGEVLVRSLGGKWL